MLNELNLHDYQKEIINFIIDKKRCQIWSFLGSGKTICTLTALTKLPKQKTLIIAPLRVCQSVWQQEAAAWEHTKHLTFSLCTGNEKQRLAGLVRKADIHIINRDNVHWLVCLLKAKWDFRTVIVDESSSFKSASALRFKSLRKIMPLTSKYVGLTGTPMSNGLLDLWTQSFFIDKGESLGRTMRAYKDRFFDADYYGYTFVPKKDSAKEIIGLIRPHTLSIQVDGFVDVLERIDIFLKIQFPTGILKKYKKFERDLIIEHRDEELTAMSRAILANKLLQWSNGASYLDGSREFVNIHCEKIIALKELIEDNSSENMIIVYNFQHDLFRIKEAFSEAVILDKNPETIVSWNEGKIKILLCHPQSAGHGINLQKGGSLIVFFGLIWSLELYQQMCGRLHRQGQKQTVRVVHLIMEGSIDERVVKVLSKKDSTQKDLLDSVCKL